MTLLWFILYPVSGCTNVQRETGYKIEAIILTHGCSISHIRLQELMRFHSELP